MLLFELILLLSSCSVCIFKKPSLKLSVILPLSLKPAIILFSIVFPSISLATPILLEKNALESLESPILENKSLF